MIKFFRRYNKRILAFLTVFLMVVFVGGSAFEGLIAPKTSNRVIGQAFGEELTESNLVEIRNQTQILSALGVPWSVPWLDRTLPPLDVISYMLLIREAVVQGQSPDLAQARSYLDKTGQDFSELQRIRKISTDQLLQAVANYLMVQQQWQNAQSGVQASELDLRQAVKDQYETLNTTIVALDIAPLVNADETVADEALLTQYEKYKDQLAEEAEDGFGYRIPDRIQVEYIKIDTSSIEPRKKITERMAEQHWQSNKIKFRRPPAASGPESQPSSQPQPEYYEIFAEAKADVLSAMKKDAQLEEGRVMADTIRRRLVAPWLDRSAAADSDGFSQAPEGVASVSYYPQMIEEMKDDLDHPSAISFGQTELFARSDASKQGGIGGSREDVSGGSGGRSFVETAFAVQGLLDLTAVAEQNRHAFLALFQTAPAGMIDDSQNLFLFRVIQADPNHAAASLEEVREKVLADVRTIRAMESTQTHAEAIKNRVASGDLKSAWESYDGLPAEKKLAVGYWFEANPFARKMEEIFPGFTLPQTIADKGGNRDYMIRSDDFATKVYQLLDEGNDRSVGIITMRDLKKVFVVQLSGVNWVARDKYETYKQQVQRSENLKRVSILKEEWFRGDKIRVRAGFATAARES